MNRLVTIILALVLVAALLSFTVTYQVRFTEAAVLTTFGKAADGAITREPGLKFKWPAPIQSVTKYDTRLRLVQAKAQTQQTRDSRQIIVETFCVWRVADPLKFFRSFSYAGDRAVDHFRKAEETILSGLRAAIGATSGFTMVDLFNPDGATRLPDLEKAIFASLTAGATAAESGEARSLAEYGIEPIEVGINRVMLPQDTTTAVFDRMAANRDRVAAEIEAAGQAQARTIRDTAESEAKIIAAFAERRAQDFRARGELEAAEFLKQMDGNANLAVFLKNMELLRTVLAKRITMVLPDSMPGLSLLSPTALDGLKEGEVPRVAVPTTPDDVNALIELDESKRLENPR